MSAMPIVLALFAKKVHIIGFDLNEKKIELYKNGIDPTNEVGNEEIEELLLNSLLMRVN